MAEANSITQSQSREEWKPLEEFTAYEICTDGRVRKIKSGVVLKPIVRKSYYFVRMFQNGRQFNRSIHQLILTTFGGPPPTKNHECNHKDGDKSHNWLDNLEWKTHKENMEHAVANGLSPSGDRHASRLYPEKVPRGSRSGMAKLTETDIPEIRRMLACGVKPGRVGKHFGVSRGTIRAIEDGITWTHVP